MKNTLILNKLKRISLAPPQNTLIGLGVFYIIITIVSLLGHSHSTQNTSCPNDTLLSPLSSLNLPEPLINEILTLFALQHSNMTDLFSSITNIQNNEQNITVETQKNTPLSEFINKYNDRFKPYDTPIESLRAALRTIHSNSTQFMNTVHTLKQHNSIDNPIPFTEFMNIMTTITAPPTEEKKHLDPEAFKSALQSRVLQEIALEQYAKWEHEAAQSRTEPTPENLIPFLEKHGNHYLKADEFRKIQTFLDKKSQEPHTDLERVEETRNYGAYIMKPLIYITAGTKIYELSLKIPLYEKGNPQFSLGVQTKTEPKRYSPYSNIIPKLTPYYSHSIFQLVNGSLSTTNEPHLQELTLILICEMAHNPTNLSTLLTRKIRDLTRTSAIGTASQGGLEYHSSNIEIFFVDGKRLLGFWLMVPTPQKKESRPSAKSSRGYT